MHLGQERGGCIGEFGKFYGVGARALPCFGYGFMNVEVSERWRRFPEAAMHTRVVLNSVFGGLGLVVADNNGICPACVGSFATRRVWLGSEHGSSTALKLGRGTWERI